MIATINARLIKDKLIATLAAPKVEVESKVVDDCATVVGAGVVVVVDSIGNEKTTAS